ncbi:MAG: hypothetical protein LBK99_04775, partial [Opitutaceae bacterium]|nr:hypothetical protein [Opitutaceae bacterium]
GPDAPQVRWLGMNYEARQNAESAARILKDFRFGSVRMWSEFRQLPYQGFRDAPRFRKNNFFVMMCLGLHDAAPGYLVPLDFTIWKDNLRREATRMRGQIDCYEVLNETNIWSGRVPVKEPDKHEEMTPAANARVIKAAAETLREIDPAIKIAGPASCHTDVNWTASVLKNGAAAHLDYITEHPYRELPELPDYEDDIASLKAAAARYRENFPLIASEAGERGIAIFPDEEIPDCERERVAFNTRMMLVALANGYEQYHHFSFDGGGSGTSWNVVLTGNPENETLSRPAPVLYALRAAADILGNFKPAGRVRLGGNYRCYLFDNGAHRIAALWKWNGNPVKFTLPENVSANASAADARSAAFSAFDVMGNPLDLASLTLSGQPVWLETELSAAELGNVLQRAALTDGANFPEARLVVTGEREFGIEITNPDGVPLSGKIRLLTPGIALGETIAFDNIPAEGKRVVRFSALAKISTTPRPFEAAISVPGKGERKTHFNLQAVLAPRVKRPLQIDGDLADWPPDSVFAKLDTQNAVATGKGDASVLMKLNAMLRLAWDEDFLYVAVETDKPDCVAQKISPASLWAGDGLQIAFDPLRNAPPNLAHYQDDDYEFSVGMFGGAPLVFMHAAAAARYDSVDKALGPVPHVRRAIRCADGKTTWELAFPRLLVSPFRLQANNAMRFSLLVNCNDGQQRVGWLELTPGIAQSPKRPGLFIDLVLLD